MRRRIEETKLSLQVNSLPIDSLKEMIDKWVTGKHTILILEKQCKYSLNPFKNLSDRFLKNWIAYCFLSKFDKVIESQIQKIEEIRISTIKQLKLQFQSYINNHLYKDSFSFHFLMIFLVASSNSFLRNKFYGPSIDDALKLEFCIMFFHCFTGLKVGDKIYKCLQQKYLKQKIARVSERQLTIFKNLEGIPIEKQLKKHHILKNIPSNNKIAKIPLKMKDHQASFRMQMKTELNEFSEELKATLEVNPLPKIQLGRMKNQDLNNFEQNSDSTFKENNQNSEKYYFSQDIYSNQLSSPLKFNHENIAVHLQNTYQNVILKRSTQKQRCSVNYVRQIQESLSNQEALPRKTKIQQRPSINAIPVSKQKLNSKDWMDLISKLKKNVFQNNSKNQKTQLISSSTFASSQDYGQETQQLKFYQNTVQSQIMNDNIIQWENKSKSNFQREFVEKSSKSHNRRVIDFNSIRQDQQRFSESCQFRRRIIHNLTTDPLQQ